MHRKLILGIAGALFLAVINANAQDTTTGGLDSIIAGPYGIPKMVMNEGGGWDIPMKVYRDEKVEVFIPDITKPGWLQWHVSEFRQKGTYFVYLYIYGRASRSIKRELVHIDTRTNTAIVEQPLLPPIRVDIGKAPISFAKSVARATAIATAEFNRFHGKTVQEQMEQQKKVIGKMASEITSPNQP